MMRRRIWGLLALPLLLTACGTAVAGTNHAASGSSTSGMSMAAPPSRGAPPQLAAMVCGDDLRGEIGQVLGLSSPPAATSTWVDPVYTCTYDLAAGPLVLSVNVAPTTSKAGAYFDSRQQKSAGATPQAGLGERSFVTPDGTVSVIKDAMTLTVDATRLPAVFGANQQKRADFAYEVASVVLGCWTGDE
jgi:hypothetical protein